MHRNTDTGQPGVRIFITPGRSESKTAVVSHYWRIREWSPAATCTPLPDGRGSDQATRFRRKARNPLAGSRQCAHNPAMRGTCNALDQSSPVLTLHPPRRGTVTLITGCMFSGKTTELLRRLSCFPLPSILAVKHTIDTRYSVTQIVSHAGATFPAIAVSDPSDIAACLSDDVEIVAIDEAHFFQESLADVVLQLASRGIEVILTSLNPNSWGSPFRVNRRLRVIADEPILMCAICARCGGTADRTQRVTPIVDGKIVGGPESYEPRCRACWTPPPESPRFSSP